MSDAHLSATDFPLHAAAERGELDRLNLLLASGIAVDLPDPFGRTPLMYALHGGQTETLRHLLKWGASVASETRGGKTALWFAVRGGNADAVRLLLSRGADPNQIVHPAPPSPSTPEQWKAMEEATTRISRTFGSFEAFKERLTTAEARIPLPRSTGPALLMSAVMSDNAEVVAALLAAGVDTTPVDHSLDTPSEEGKKPPGFSALHFAAGNASSEIVRLLIQHRVPSDPELEEGVGSPLMGAINAGRLDNARVLLIHGTDPNAGTMPPLAFAVFRDDTELAKLLLSFGASTKNQMVTSMARNKPDFLALFESHNGTAWHRAVLAGDAEAVRLALGEGADVNSQDDKGRTAINIAARRGDVAMVAVLLDLGADVNAADTTRATPLYNAVLADSLPTVTRLIEAGADVDAATKYGTTPLRLTFSENRHEIRERLLDAGARLDFALAMLFGDVTAVRQSLEQGTPVDRADPSGLTALMAAAIRGDGEMLGELHDRWNANIHAVDSFGKTALFHALSAAKTEPALAIADRLLGWGADIEAEDNTGKTPLETAVMTKETVLVTAMLDRGADPNHKSQRSHRSVLHDLMLLSSAFKGNNAIAQILIERGADVNARNKSGETPLDALLTSVRIRKETALEDAKIDTILSLIDLLVFHGADVNAHGRAGVMLTSAIDSGSVAIVRRLLDHGLVVSEEENLALMFTHAQKTPEIVELLKERSLTSKTPEWLNSLPINVSEITKQVAEGKMPRDMFAAMRKQRAERQRQPWITAD